MQTQQRARDAGYIAKSPARVMRFLAALSGLEEQLVFLTGAGEMGAEAVAQYGFRTQTIGCIKSPTCASDTVELAKQISLLQPHILVFVGGDGTAIDVYKGASSKQLVLGVPAGVKMHSGVYANTPEDAAKIITALTAGDWLNTELAEIRDIDEASFRQNRVLTQCYGEMRVPRNSRWLQSVKCSGREQDALVLEEIASWLEETSNEFDYEVIGPGSSTSAYMEHLGLQSTLLGADIIYQGRLLYSDVSEKQLLEFLQKKTSARVRLLITPIAGQGHILGRGNQQFSVHQSTGG